MADFQKIGVDIGSTSLKVVELAPAGRDRWKLMAAAAVGTPAGGIVANAANSAVVTQALAKLLKEAGIKSRRAVVALPEEQVSSHVVEMPLMNDEEVGQALAWQVEQYIPIPAERAVWSHQVIKRDTGAGTMEVLLVAAAKNLVSTFTGVCEQAGLEVVAVETELMAMARAVAMHDVPLFLIVDMGANGTDIGIVSHNQLVFSRTIPTGSNAFTRAIESGLNLDTATAEQYKTSYGFAEDKLKGELVKVMTPVLNTIANEVRKTADFYLSKHPGEQVRMVSLTGGAAALPEMVGKFSGMVGIEVALGNPLNKVSANSQQSAAIEASGPIYTVAMGLAMREV